MRAWALAMLVLVGCADERSPETLHVFAASSLTDAFEALGARFEARNPGAEVVFSFGASQMLRLQIEQGAPADVFASADPVHVDALVDADRVRDARVFAHNALCVIVPRDNPAGLETFDDLRRAERVVIGDPSVPVGRYARESLARAGADFEAEVLRHVVSEEGNVRLVRAKVELGEADAAIVYRSDAVTSDRVTVIEIPAALDVRADYSIGVVSTSSRSELARRWIAYVESEVGQRALAEHGFVPLR